MFATAAFHSPLLYLLHCLAVLDTKKTVTILYYLWVIIKYNIALRVC